MRRTVGAAWWGVAALLCLGSLVVAAAETLQSGMLAPAVPWSARLDWRPGMALHEAWRLWTCAWVHWSPRHLAVNLAGATVVAAVGWRARASSGTAWAWFLAWPLTHLLMNVPGSAGLPDELRHYGGMSGVLHAGVIVLGLSLAWPAGAQSGGEDHVEPYLPLEPSLAPLTVAQATRHRLIGFGLLAGTVAKVLLETPWNLALRPNPTLGIQVAPLAHACGIVAGLLGWSAVTLMAASGRARKRARR